MTELGDEQFWEISHTPRNERSAAYNRRTRALEPFSIRSYPS
jgi:hypothetical protein